jgi:dihydrodipicolinate synthase/N-acetylneuraminate lyase
MAAGSNIFPRLFVDLYDAAVAGDLENVKRLHDEVIAFGKAVYHGENPLRGLKHGLKMLGICSSLLTEPLFKYSPEDTACLEQYIQSNRSRILNVAAV